MGRGSARAAAALPPAGRRPPAAALGLGPADFPRGVRRHARGVEAVVAAGGKSVAVLQLCPHRRQVRPPLDVLARGDHALCGAAAFLPATGGHGVRADVELRRRDGDTGGGGAPTLEALHRAPPRARQLDVWVRALPDAACKLRGGHQPVAGARPLLDGHVRRPHVQLVRRAGRARGGRLRGAAARLHQDDRRSERGHRSARGRALLPQRRRTLAHRQA
mmetsp:Transcript_4918/g.15994  ORF Transcript_4918/g.15994 Transcript_4918/m.15994 type:complete len:219 (-) Transcript_4918:541-1197(-)